MMTNKTHRASRSQMLSAAELLENRIVLAADLMTAPATAVAEEVETEVVEVSTVNLDGNAMAQARFGDPGDFNNDGSIDAVDIDMLSDVMNGSQATAIYDLTGDGNVNMDDMDELIHVILGTQYGDADLDGKIDMVDFWMMNRNMFSNRSGWSQGDFNFDGQVDASDFGVWNHNKFFTRPVAVSSAQRPSPIETADVQENRDDADDASWLREEAVDVTQGLPLTP